MRRSYKQHTDNWLQLLAQLCIFFTLLAKVALTSNDGEMYGFGVALVVVSLVPAFIVAVSVVVIIAQDLSSGMQQELATPSDGERHEETAQVQGSEPAAKALAAEADVGGRGALLAGCGDPPGPLGPIHSLDP